MALVWVWDEEEGEDTGNFEKKDEEDWADEEVEEGFEHIPDPPMVVDPNPELIHDQGYPRHQLSF